MLHAKSVEGLTITVRCMILVATFVVSLPGGLSAESFHHKCSSCHSGALPAAGSKAEVDDPCFACHTGEHGQAGAGHQALAARGSNAKARSSCLVCHDPHAGTGPAMLARPSATGLASLDPGSRRCVDCHEGHMGARPGSGKHPIGIMVRQLASRDSEPVFHLPLTDVAGTEDPNDDVITCTTCHDVHASKHRYLLRWSREDVVDGCTSCHSQRRPRERAKPVEASLRTE